MSIENAKLYLEKFNVLDKISIHDELISTVAMAAEQIGCNEGQIAKSLAFKVKDDIVLVVVAGDKKVDNRKYKDFFGVKAKMLSADETLEFIGHEVGGVCPFGVNENVKIYLDKSLKEHDVIHPSCGSRDSSIELTVEELENIVEYISWIDISK